MSREHHPSRSKPETVISGDGFPRGPPEARMYSSVKAVAERYEVDPATIWRWSNDLRYRHLNFPTPIRFGPNTTRWSNDQLDQFDAGRVALGEEV